MTQPSECHLTFYQLDELRELLIKEGQEEIAKTISLKNANRKNIRKFLDKIIRRDEPDGFGNASLESTQYWYGLQRLYKLLTGDDWIR